MQTLFRNKINFLINAVLLVGILSFSTCLDPIDLDIPKGFENTLVIQGILVKGEISTFELTVSRLFDFTPESIARVNVREVILTDDEGTSIEIERRGTGFYRKTIDASSGIDIEAGKSYKVNFSTFDGRSYESRFEPLVQVPEIDTITFEPVSRESVFTDGTTTVQDSALRFYINTPLTPAGSEQKVSLFWNLRETFRVSQPPSFTEEKICYVTESLAVTQVRAFDGINTASARLDQFTVYDHPFNGRLAEGNYFEVIQYGLSPGAFEYWDQIGQVLDRDGNMFETPAGPISTNFFNTIDSTEQVFGYFYATTSDTARVFVAPEVAGNPRAICPPLGPSDNPCPEPLCCDCLSARISSVEKPSFWTQ